MIIHLDPPLPKDSSGTTRRADASNIVYVSIERLPIRPCFDWGLPSREVTSTLVSSYLTVSPLPRLRRILAVFFSVALSADHPTPPLTANLLCEVPTFLSRASPQAIIHLTLSCFKRFFILLSPKAGEVVHNPDTSLYLL